LELEPGLRRLAVALRELPVDRLVALAFEALAFEALVCAIEMRLLARLP
jgi:hypothetical protein